MTYRIKNEPGTPYFSKTGDACILLTSRTGATTVFYNCFFPDWKMQFESREQAEKYVSSHGYTEKGEY